MRISKHHGLRNDFLVVLDEANRAPISVGPDLARRLCDRRSGLGADGLIHGAHAVDDRGADVVMHLWNADGGRAEMSGNGTRCLAQALARSRGSSGTLLVATDAGLREVTVTATDDAHEALVQVDMGVVGPGHGGVGFESPVPVKEVGTADLGNPHLVLWLDEGDGATLDEVPLHEVGPAIESRFAGGMNVELLVPLGEAPDSTDRVRMRVWERGAGLTEACGTGACAVAHLAHQWGLVGSSVTVDMPGGAVAVDLVDGRALLTGPSVVVAELELVAGSALDG